MRLASKLPDRRRFSWQVDLRLIILAFVVLFGVFAAMVYNGRRTEHASAGTAGGPGANFLVRWSGPVGVDEPLIEAVMVGRSANAGVSFTSVGRVVTTEPQ